MIEHGAVMKSTTRKAVADLRSVKAPKPTVRADDETYFDVMDIDPTTAAAFLDKNTDNRPIGQNRVEAFARVMKNGGWKVNNQAIGFDVDGNLIDGQHRLWAIVESGITVRISVAYNVAKDAIKTIDRGATRSIAEVLRRDGVIPGPKRVTAWCNGERQLLTNMCGKGGVEDTEAYYQRNHKAIDLILEVLPDKAPFKPAMVGAALVFAHKKHPAAVEAFVRGLVDGTGLDKDSPIWVARETIIGSIGNVKGQRRPLALKILRAVQAHLRGEKVRRSHMYATESSLHFFQGKK